MADDIGRPGPAAGAPEPLEPAPGSAGALDIAMDAERHDPAPDSPARVLLVRQARLVDLQITSERFGIAFKLMWGLAAALVAAALGWMVWDASRADGLVIEAFTVPPDLAAKGLTGEVAAAQLQDRLADLTAGTQSARAPESFRNEWAGDIEVQIPQTGVSVGELQRFLRQQFGHETRVAGSMVRTADGLRLTARVEGRPGDVVTGPEDSLDRMMARAAERVMERTQPYRFGAYLERRGRGQEAQAVYARMLENGPASERPWALTGLARGGDNRRRLALLKEAVRLDPDLALVWANLAATERTLGLHEAELSSRRQALRALSREDRGGVAPIPARVMEGWMSREAADLLADNGRALRAIEAVEAATEFDGSHATAPLFRAQHLARNYDVTGARRALGGRGDDGALMASLIGYDFLVPNAEAAAALDNWPAVLAQLRRTEEVAARQDAPFRRDQALTRLRPLIAQALARTGRVAEGEALIGGTALDCYPCLRVRGEIAALKRDWAGADRWFAQAVRQGPSLPHAYSEAGEAKLARGDLEGAIRLFRQAQRRGPAWADPLKFEGDALQRLGRHRAAIGRYRKAAERAPRWGALHLAWGRSLEAMGRGDEARRKYAQAARLDLSAADRADTVRRLHTAEVL